jgi:hypothetical protein
MVRLKVDFGLVIGKLNPNPTSGSKVIFLSLPSYPCTLAVTSLVCYDINTMKSKIS